DLIRRHVLYAWDHAGDVAYHSQALPGRNAALLDRASVYIREYWRPDTYYTAMVDEVARIVPAFTLASVPGAEQLLTTNRDLLAADASVSSVPGSFTLKGWQDEMRSRIEDSEARLKSDWVLQEAFQGQSMDMRSWLLETYHKDYRAHWNRFLSAVDVIPPDGVAVAANRVHDLADRTSPLVRLLDVAASNLRFKSANGGEESPKELAAIEDDFAALHALFTVQGEGDNAKRPMDAYLIQLNGVLETLQQRQQSGDVGSSSVQFAKSVLGGTLTEKNAIAEACAFSDLHGTGLPGADLESTTAVRTLLKRTPEAGWRGILADAQRMLDVAWGNDVWGPFHDTLNGKYPFQSGGPDAPLAEFTRFFGTGGVFWNFYDADLAPFLDRDGNAKVMFRHGLLISPESAAAIAKAQEFRRALFADEAAPGKLGVTFRVKPAQTTKVSGQAPYVRTTRFSIAETRIVYDMGLSKETKVSWPGAQGIEGASVAVSMDGNEPGELNEPGPWGLFKLLDKSKITARTDSESEVRFRMERAGEYVIEVPYLIRASTVPHPFRASFFQFDCPRQLSPAPGSTAPAPAATTTTTTAPPAGA
ncbi:MAG TPA: ImcF-related family protein, partial [bacterium]|nr:ImcF-related family protein [bacterium]